VEGNSSDLNCGALPEFGLKRMRSKKEKKRKKPGNLPVLRFAQRCNREFPFLG
jgi:hypothetical protein